MATPDLKTFENGGAACNFIVACHKDGYGKGIDFIKCEAHNKVATALAKYKVKGDRIIVVGQMVNRHYENYKKEDVYEVVLHASKINYQERLTVEEKNILKKAKAEKEKENEINELDR